jgi:radical SAM superfamily enzyme YgiQ (UPF0313 family)
MGRSIYIVNPASDFATYYSAEVLVGSGLPRAALVADLAIATLAALVPKDWQITLCDENCEPINFDVDVDWVCVTGKVNQRNRMISIAHEFRRRGKRVAIGGPLASLSPDLLRPHCDVIVRGEAEEIADLFFSDISSTRYRNEYIGERPDLSFSPVPRWDLYKNDRALMGALQTSRGCPFECEFCDVIQYLGRKQRHKPVANVIAELDLLHTKGYRTVFLADDNFTAYRRRCRELLEAIAAWQPDRPMSFVTQLSIDAGREPDLLDLCAAAQVNKVFIGIETPNTESLKEAKKRQNVNVDLLEQTDRFVDHGLSVMGGLIVGFDADDKSIFERQFEFAMSMAIPIFSLGALVAPEATPLYSRIVNEGRLIAGGEVQLVPWTSNIMPLNMSLEELHNGLHWLSNALYRPQAFGERMLRFIKRFGQASPYTAKKLIASALREIEAQVVGVAGAVRKLGDEENDMFRQIMSAATRRPVVMPFVLTMLFQYAQIRYMFDVNHFWDPRVKRPH